MVDITDAKFAEYINRELKNILNRFVKQHLESILAEIPVDGLIRETRMAQSYR
jgi:hypothetical protein